METKIESKQSNLICFEVKFLLFACGIDKIDVNLK